MKRIFATLLLLPFLALGADGSYKVCGRLVNDKAQHGGI